MWKQQKLTSMNWNTEAIIARTRLNCYSMRTFSNLFVLINRSVSGTNINNRVYSLGKFHHFALRRQPLKLLNARFRNLLNPDWLTERPFIHPMALRPISGLGLLYSWVSVTAVFYGRLLAPRPTPNLEDQVSVFITPGDRVAQLHPWALGSSGTSGMPFPVPTIVGPWGRAAISFSITLLHGARNNSRICRRFYETCLWRSQYSYR
jgi:hypothetical protein